jgi:predicted flap endonuclease-1-like 5' DNA nuclease
MANYKIEDLEGVGEALGQKFREAGIKDTDTLLTGSKKPAQRKHLAEKTGISEKMILKFANMVDLYRINGIGSEYSELLEAAGVDTVPDLARRNPQNLAQKIAEVNDVKKLARRIPTESEITKWVDQAKKLPRILDY